MTTFPRGSVGGDVLVNDEFDSDDELNIDLQARDGETVEAYLPRAEVVRLRNHLTAALGETENDVDAEIVEEAPVPAVPLVRVLELLDSRRGRADYVIALVKEALA